MSIFKKIKKETSTNYVKLKDGDEVVGVFIGDPIEFYSNFETKEKKDKWQEGYSYRFAINFYVYGTKLNNAKDYERNKYLAIFENGKRFAKELDASLQEYGMDTVFKIKRKGTGKDGTTYSILFNRKMTEEESKELVSLPLINLNNFTSQQSSKKIDGDYSSLGNDPDLPDFGEAPLPEMTECPEGDVPF